MKKKRYNILSLLVALVLVTVAGSCKKYFDPPLVFEPDPGPNLSKDRKVLLISIDGLAGLELYNYVPTNISKLLEHSKYTFEGIADANTRDASTWTTMLSGKSSAKHGVHTADFSMEEEDDDHIDHEGSGESIGYVSVYQRLLETGRVLRTLSVSPWEPLDKHLFNLSDENGVVASDEAVRDKAVDRIKNGDNNLTFSVVNFRDVNTAGEAGGFSMDNAAYKAALDRIDGYIGEIVEAVEQRKRSANEDWLIIITSNHGGNGNSYGGASLEERKVPVILYNTNFVGQQFETPELTNSLNINTQSVNTPTIPAANSSDYQIRNTGEYTILFKVMHKGLTGSNTVILGKSNHAYSNVRGWHFMYEGASKAYRMVLNDGTGGNSPFMVYGPSSKVAVLNTWQSVVAKIYNEDGKRYLKVFVDGVPGNASEITRNPENTAVNFIIGSGSITSIGTFNGEVNNLVFIPKALSDEDIQSFTCMSTINENTSFWNDVTGFWPLNEGSGKVFKNRIVTSSNTDFQFTDATYSWNLKEAWSCLSDEENKNFVLVYHNDILPQIFYWLNIETHTSWGLEGSVFLDKFEIEFIGK